MSATRNGETPGPSGAGARRARRNQTLFAVVATMGGLLFGYDTGVIAGALLYIRQDLHLSSASQGVVVSSLLVGAAFGASFGGRFADAVGRRRTIRLASVVFILGTLGSALAPNAAVMVVARVVLGLAVGCVSATVPVYIGEISPADRRGRLVNQNEVMIVIGQLLAYIANAVIAAVWGGHGTWRWMLGIGIVPAIILLIGMGFLPETPRWLALKGRYDEAEAVLRQVAEPDHVRPVFEGLHRSAERHAQERGRKGGWADLRVPWVRRLFGIGIGIAICQQITGINTVIYYGPTILESTGLAANASVTASIAIGVTGVIAVSIGMYLLGRVHRRPLLITGQVGTTCALLAMGLLFLLPESTTRSYAILLCMVIFVGFQQCCISTVTWLLLSEIFPLRIRGFAMGVAVFVLWGVNFAISLLFPVVNAAAGPTWTFLAFVVLGIAAIVFSTTQVPETKGHSLEELEDRFRATGRPATAH